MIKRKLITLSLLGVISVPGWALSEARLLGLSGTGQTALFNLGMHDGVKDGDYAVIVKEVKDLSTRSIRLLPVARARNVKISTGNSVWILYKTFHKELLAKGDAYLILSESQMLSGRRDPRFDRISVVSEKDKIAYGTKNALSNDKDRLSKLQNQYPEIQPLHGPEVRSDRDGELIDVDAWKKVSGSKYRTAIYKSPNAADFRRELRLSTFEKMVTAYLLKVNEPKFNYETFYDEQMKTQFTNEFRQRSNFSTEYENFISTEAQKAVSDARLHRSMLEKGQSWSEDFSDEELRRVLNQVSVLQEKDRRKVVVDNPTRYAVFLNYGMTFNDSQTEKDPGYRRDGRYSVDFDFEGTPVIKHETLERFTLNGTFRINKTAMEASDKNASVDEVSVSGGINWYPLYAPHAIEKPAIFIGTYIRSGTAKVNSPSLNEKANYTVLSLPGFRAGMRYNFRNNFGLRVALTMETINLDRYEQSKFGATLPDQASLVEGKMNFALAYAF